MTAAVQDFTADTLEWRPYLTPIVFDDVPGNVCADFHSGDTPKAYAVEGIGMSYLPETVNLKVIDEIQRVSDRESFLMARRIARVSTKVS